MKSKNRKLGKLKFSKEKVSNLTIKQVIGGVTGVDTGSEYPPPNTTIDITIWESELYSVCCASYNGAVCNSMNPDMACDNGTVIKIKYPDVSDVQ